MNESANGNRVTEVEKEIPARQQLREFDFKFLQQLPDLSKEVMQHLIEHPEELRARLRYYGLEDVARTSTRNILSYNDSNERKFTWSNFYGDVFGVAPDFSRVRVPQHNTLYTYVTPIFVATKLPIPRIIDAIAAFGVQFFTQHGPDITDAHKFAAVRDIGRSDENYIAVFSERIVEDIPRPPFKDEERYRATHMTLREYLLWVAYTLYCHRSADKAACYLESLHHCFGDHSLLGSKICDLKRKERLMLGGERTPEEIIRLTDLATSPNVNFREGVTSIGNVFNLRLSTVSPRGYMRYKPCDGVRRVKLFRSLPQI